MLNVGMYLADRYEIVSKVGAGGMSDVYKAKDHILGRVVAIKVLKSEFSEDRNFVSKFRTEAQSAAGLEHPNVVNIYDVGSEDGLYYIVMEYVEGITLKTYIEKKGQLSFKESASIAIQVARGIEAAHNKDIIHRDIKPQNIIISTEGKVKVTDFGIARAASSNTISADVMGSVHYASPEQARNGFVDGRSDIYSLGIVMYEMVTGRVPFDGDTTVAVAIQHLQEEMPDPKVYAPDIPVSFAKIILKCAQKNPDRRYQTVAELLADLRKSMITPDEDFVVMAPLVDNGKTKVISKDELDEIGKERKIDAVLVSSPTNANADDDDEYDEDDEDDEDEDDEDGKGVLNPKLDKAVTIVAIVAAILIVILIICIGVSIGKALKKDKNSNTQTETVSQTDTESESDSDLVAMINIVGMSQEKAKEALAKYGLDNIWVEKKIKSDEKEGTILYQSIEEGEMIEPGTLIKIRIAGTENKDYSVDNEVVTMIDVLGYSEDDATKALEELGLKVKSPVLYVESEEDEKDKVVEVQSTSGTKLKKGTTLSSGTEVVLCIGKGKESVTVPTFAGQDKATAKSSLESAGLVVTETEEYSSSVAEGKAIKLLNTSTQKEIAAGDKLKDGTAVTLVISKGEEPVQASTYKTSSPVTFTATENTTKVVYVLMDSSKSQVLSAEKTITDFTNKEIVISYSGLGTVPSDMKGVVAVTVYTKVESTDAGSDPNDTTGDGSGTTTDPVPDASATTYYDVTFVKE